VFAVASVVGYVLAREPAATPAPAPAAN
jgi:hypothetical protein